MSRVGKMPVTIPAGVDVSVKDDQISVKGSGGALSLAQNVLVKVSSNDGKLSFEPANESREANAIRKEAEPGGRGLQSCCYRCSPEPDGRLFAPSEF